MKINNVEIDMNQVLRAHELDCKKTYRLFVPKNNSSTMSDEAREALRIKMRNLWRDFQYPKHLYKIIDLDTNKVVAKCNNLRQVAEFFNFRAYVSLEYQTEFPNRIHKKDDLTKFYKVDKEY